MARINDNKRAVDCFAYGRHECTALNKWYNPDEKCCVLNKKMCPFYKTERGNDRYIPPRNGRYWYIFEGEVRRKIYTCSEIDKERMYSGNMYKSESEAEKALKE